MARGRARETGKARAGLVEVFPRAGELSENPSDARPAADLAADGAESAALEHAIEHDPSTTANGSQPQHPPPTRRVNLVRRGDSVIVSPPPPRGRARMLLHWVAGSNPLPNSLERTHP